jgi:amino acid adenylation domain-containing protein/thioester reductase-like protein
MTESQEDSVEALTEFLASLADNGVRLAAEGNQLHCFAKGGALTSQMRDGIARYKSEILALFEGMPEQRREGAREFPLSAAQKGLYILHRLYPGISAYNVPLCFQIRRDVDPALLERAWEHVLDQFPILTARIIEKGGELYHRLDNDCRTRLRHRTVQFSDDNAFHAFLRAQAKIPLDLDRGPLTRIELFTRDGSESVILIAVHHIIFDGVSAVILLRTLSSFYEALLAGKPVRLAGDLPGYAEFVAWEQAMLSSAEGASHAAFWQRQLAGDLPVLRLLPGQPASSAATFEGRTIDRIVPAKATGWVQSFTQTSGFRPSVVFLAAFQLLLHRETKDDDIIVGMPVMRRPEARFASEVGYFVNMVPIRARLRHDMGLSEVMRSAQGALLDAVYHSTYPFPLMVENLKNKKGGKNPVFQVMYAYQNYVQQAGSTSSEAQGLDIRQVPGIAQEGDFDLGLEVFEDGASYRLHLKYNPHIYPDALANGLVEQYCSLLTAIGDNPNRPLAEYSSPVPQVRGASVATPLSPVRPRGVSRRRPSIVPVDRADLERFPLGFAQERLWFADQMEPGSVRYNYPAAVRITREMDIAQIQHALNLLIERHESLRTIFPSRDGQPEQVILDHQHLALEQVDLTNCENSQDRARIAREICQAEASRPFDLALGPLIRGKVIKLADTEHILLLNMHHIVSDAWSMGVLIKEFSMIVDALRKERPVALDPLPIQYLDYAVWQRTSLENSGILDEQLSYWKGKLAGVPESLDLVTDYARPSVQSLAGDTHFFTLDAALTASLKSLSQRHGATLYMVLLAAVDVLLYRYSGQGDTCVGSLIANRQYAETEGLIGIFFNTLALRNQIDGEDTFASFLARVKATCREAYAHQDAPFERVVDVARPRRSAAISPLFQVMVILHAFQSSDFGPDMEPYHLDNLISQFDLTVGFRETADGLAGSIVYSTALFKPETIARMADHLVALCREIAAAPNARIRDLDCLTEPERHRLLHAFNDTAAEYPKDQCIHELFAARADGTPESTAVICGDESLNYRELENASGDLALYLQSKGVGPECIAGLCLDRSVEMMLGIMGIVRAGGAYMPLDPEYPDERLAYMLHDSGAAIVLTHERLRPRIERLVKEAVTVISLDTKRPAIARWAAAARRKGISLAHNVSPANICYVIYTSGSTGKPKAVLTEHRSLVNRIHWMQKEYRLTAADVVLQKTPYTFDVSVWEFFWPMIAGAALVFATPGGHRDTGYLEALIQRAGVTTLHFVPSMLRAFLDSVTNPCLPVKRIFCSGEALDGESAERCSSQFPNASLYNLYGPTEAAIDVTAYDCSSWHVGSVPIGAPIDNTQIYILDRFGRPQPIGVPGELCIAGDGLARGYLNQPELTDQKFISNPFGPCDRMYRSGDLARWLDDGNLQYLGRIDTQVKIRGFRIETGEIEAQLNRHPEIRESAVIARGEGPGTQLVAFYRAVGEKGGETVQLPAGDLRAHLSKTLPEYMIPAAFISVAAIPLNSSGKADRRALAGMDVEIASGQQYVAPRNRREAELVEIWAKLLNLPPERIGVNDNFFELGGHSLLAVKLIDRLKQAGMRASLPELFAAPTLAKLAEVVTDAGSEFGEEAPTDFEQEAALDPAIVARTEGARAGMQNVLVTGATGFVGAFLLSELLRETTATIYCLVRSANIEDGHRKIEERMKSFGLWEPMLRQRVMPLPGDLAEPQLGLTHEKVTELADTLDAIYHSGASVNFIYPYSALKSANVGGTEELLRIASVGRAKSFHFVSTLHVTSTRTPDHSRTVITEVDPLPMAQELWDGYAQTKWVAEKLVGIAGSRGIPVAIYRAPQIIGHSRTGVSNLGDFVPSVIRGCMQLRCVPEDVLDDALHLVPVDFVSRSVVTLSQQRDLIGRVFHLTNPDTLSLRRVLNCLLEFDRTLQAVPYQTWRSRVLADPRNALARYIASFPDQVPDRDPGLIPTRFECEGTLGILESAGVGRPHITPELLHAFFAYLAGHASSS